MIDHPEITEHLIAKLNDALPLPPGLIPKLRDTLRRQNADTAISAPGHHHMDQLRGR
jgi:hypothetical protein